MCIRDSNQDDRGSQGCGDGDGGESSDGDSSRGNRNCYPCRADEDARAKPDGHRDAETNCNIYAGSNVHTNAEAATHGNIYADTEARADVDTKAGATDSNAEAGTDRYRAANRADASSRRAGVFGQLVGWRG